MNREIKFKIWTKRKSKWYQRIIEIVFGRKKNSFGDLPVLSKGSKIFQFTGLKDDNGKDIYEGDIVIALNSDNKYKSIVEWDEKDGRWGFKSIKCGNMSFSYNLTYGCSRWEICGNIFETPELLEK